MRARLCLSIRLKGSKYRDPVRPWSKESLKLGTSSPSFSLSRNPVWGRNLVYGPDWPGDLHTVLLLQPCKQHRQDVLTGKTWHGQASYFFPPGPRPGQLLWPSGISVAGGHLETLCRAGFHPLGFCVTLPSIPYPVLASHCQPQVSWICGDSGPQNRVSIRSRGMGMEGSLNLRIGSHSRGDFIHFLIWIIHSFIW